MADNLIAGKASNLVCAAMETAGAAIQSDMLDWVSGADGQGLAGLLYLLSIASAVIIFVSGGNYKWGRYLLIGPTLFMFLTTVRSQSDGTQWAFGDRNFEEAALKKSLVGVIDKGTGTGIRVSLFFKFWNAFTSEVSHKLISSLNLDQSESEFSLVKKVETYMMTWDVLARIHDDDLRTVIKLTLSNKCRTFFDELRKINTPGNLPSEVTLAQAVVKEYDEKPVFLFQGDEQTFGWPKEVLDWVKKKNFQGRAFTCRQLWEEIVPDAQEEMKDVIDQHLARSLAPGESLEKVKETYYLKIGEYTGKYENSLEDGEGLQQGAKQYAIDWLVAKAMWEEIWEQNSYTASNAMQGGNPLIFSAGGPVPASFSGNNEDASTAIQQFNKTEVYGQRSEFVTAALSMPHFQGVGLLILSASFPFFAMLLVVPGRALNFLTWMGLWAWLKLWDLGFAVVMLIDNMLYSMFPRGMNLKPGELKDPGIAWAKIFEIDPTHSEAVYYNLIATCLFAVPVVTAVFVKGGSGELGNIINQNWQQYAAKIAGGASSYSRSQQAQGHMDRLQRIAYSKADQALYSYLGSKSVLDQVASITEKKRKLAAEITVASNGELNDVQKIAFAVRQAEIDQMGVAILKDADTAYETAYYQVSAGSYGQYAANRAVATGFYSHDLRSDPPFKKIYQNKLESEFYDSSKAINALTNAVKGRLGK